MRRIADIRGAIFTPVLLALLVCLAWGANGAEYLVIAIDGASPQMAPVPDLPARFVRVGDRLGQGTDFLMISRSKVVLRNTASGEEFTVTGPNRVRIGAGRPTAGDPSRMKVSNAMALQPAYFPDPKTAVAETARLMRARSWAELARYYDLSGTDIAIGDLLSGRFFMRDKPPSFGHPAGFDRYIQPFAPAFSYLSHQSIGDGLVEVTVHVEIDEGGGMVQRGLDSFRMRKSAKGYQLLPKTPK